MSALDKALVVKDALRSWEKIRAGEVPSTALHGDRTRFPVPALSGTVWSIRAGDPSIMSTPAAAEMQFWVDLLPGDDRDDVLRRFEDHLRTVFLADDYLSDRQPQIIRLPMRQFVGTAVATDHPIVGAIQRAHESVAGPIATVGGTAANDSMTFNLYSTTPAMTYGPGSTVTAHSPNEHLAIDDLITATKTLALTIADFCGGELKP